MTKKKEITILTDVCQVTCVVERGFADKMIRAAKEAGAHATTTYYVKSSGDRSRFGIFGASIDSEKEVIHCIVGSDQSERFVERLYLVGGLENPGRGFIYVTPLEKAATYIPRDMIERLSKKSKSPAKGS